MGGVWKFWERCGGCGKKWRDPERMGRVRRLREDGRDLEVFSGVRRGVEEWEGSGDVGQVRRLWRNGRGLEVLGEVRKGVEEWEMGWSADFGRSA